MTHSDRYGRRGSERRDRGRDRERYDDRPVKRRRRGGRERSPERRRGYEGGGERRRDRDRGRYDGGRRGQERVGGRGMGVREGEAVEGTASNASKCPSYSSGTRLKSRNARI